MTGPDSFFADNSLGDTIVLKVELAAANDEIERLRETLKTQWAQYNDMKIEVEHLREREATLRTTAQSLCKWYEGQEGLREALEGMVATVDRAKGQPVTFFEGMKGCSVTQARVALAHHNAATPLWGPLLDCMEKNHENH